MSFDPPVDSTAPLPITLTEASLDAFVRQRVSNPDTIFDSKQLNDAQPAFWDDAEVSGSGTGSTHDPARASTTLSVSAATAGRRLRQTFMRFNYQPGKSQAVLMTGVLGRSGMGPGIVTELGYGDDNNGLFFRLNEGGLEVVRVSGVTGAPVEEVVPQAAWSADDKLDGAGASGITLDPTKTLIFFIDFEWLGVGQVRMGVVIAGVLHYLHRFRHSNVLDSVYMSTPNLPLRYSIENSGAGGAASIEHICATVISEGGTQERGVARSHLWNPGNPVDANDAGDVYAVIGMRLKPGYIDATVVLTTLSVMNVQNDDFEWLLVWNPTIDTPGDITTSTTARSPCCMATWPAATARRR